MVPKFKNLNDKNALFILASINNSISNFSWGTGSDVNMIENIKFKLPIKYNNIDFEFIESLISELEEERISELEAYLQITGLDNYELTEEEKNALSMFDTIEWKEFNLEKLFGKSNRGKRLKSFDRISGTLPFVTAGEANEGISDFIGNKVEIFNENTITIDMFGSAKYRNYKYGADDHIAVVHTENIEKYASIFVTSAIHKSSHNGQFNYGKNFYAKDADELYIQLPIIEDKPNYKYMFNLISAVQKLVIKDVVLYKNKKIELTKKIVDKI